MIIYQNDLVQINYKPDFQKLGEKFGKQMKNVIQAINSLDKIKLQKIIHDRKTDYDIGENKAIGYQDFIVEEIANDGLQVSSNSSFKVAITTNITEELKNEGIVRDLIRSVQNFRKELDFNVSDRINISIESNEEIVRAIHSHEKYFLNEVLGINIDMNGEKLDFEKAIEISNQKVKLGLSKDYKG